MTLLVTTTKNTIINPVPVHVSVTVHIINQHVIRLSHISHRLISTRTSIKLPNLNPTTRSTLKNNLLITIIIQVTSTNTSVLTTGRLNSSIQTEACGIGCIISINLNSIITIIINHNLIQGIIIKITHGTHIHRPTTISTTNTSFPNPIPLTTC